MNVASDKKFLEIYLRSTDAAVYNSKWRKFYSVKRRYFESDAKQEAIITAFKKRISRELEQDKRNNPATPPYEYKIVLGQEITMTEDIP